MIFRVEISVFPFTAFNFPQALAWRKDGKIEIQFVS